MPLHLESITNANESQRTEILSYLLSTGLEACRVVAMNADVKADLSKPEDFKA